jgi:hypothetical protein
VTEIDAEKNLADIHRMLGTLRELAINLGRKSASVETCQNFDVVTHSTRRNTVPIRNHHLQKIAKIISPNTEAWARGDGQAYELTPPMIALVGEIAELDADIAAGRARAK